MKTSSEVFKNFCQKWWVLILALPLNPITGQTDFHIAFDEIGEQSFVVPLKYDLTFDQSGGHLQGIQIYRHENQEYVFMSGSSSEVAFMALAKIGASPEVTRIDTLYAAPYRHAGGFQIMDHYLAVGIEDNLLRTSSRVAIYDLRPFRKTGLKPIHIIKRDGKYERLTAGAVGIARVEDLIYLVVANWDSKHLDWYRCTTEAFEKGKNHFRKVGNLTMGEVNRSKWSDSDWLSYQNINLVSEPGGSLYLAGFGTTSDGQNVADLYRVMINEESIKTQPDTRNHSNPPIHMIKIASRSFKSVGSTSFRYGAGLCHFPEGTWGIISCAEHLTGQSVICIYKQ